MVKNFKGPNEILCDGVETVSKFTYLGDRLNATGGCETAVIARTRIGWINCRECSEILKGRKFSLKMKWKVYKSCVRSDMLYGSEAWCLRERDGNFKNRKSDDSSDVWCEAIGSKKQHGVEGHVGNKRVLDRMAKACSRPMRWYGHVLRKENENVIMKALKFEVSGSRGRPKQTGKKQVENEMRKNGLVKENACDRTKWRGVVKTMTIRNPANSVDNTGSNM